MKLVGFRSKKPWKMGCAGFFYAFVLLVIVIAIIDPSTEENAEPASADVEAEEPEEVEEEVTEPQEEEPTPEPEPVELEGEALLEQIVIDELGEKTNNDSPTYESIALNDYAEDPNKKVILLTLNGNDNFTANMMKKGMWIDSIGLLEQLNDNFDIQEVAFRWQLPLTDEFGNTENGEVLRINLYGDTIDKINFDGFLHDNLPSVADEYWEHPAFSN
ncbi:hypothetical protein [Halalkalibacter urbisdiaboli]|uniref:hypothetical protein n=1 Tax=Halalkalibacter urbisdiaboli TaxID=1960589 RepID=UPI000B437A31|nr:hypothetical protein [Halalkalibacter urbisdiaboli]